MTGPSGNGLAPMDGEVNPSVADGDGDEEEDRAGCPNIVFCPRAGARPRPLRAGRSPGLASDRPLTKSNTIVGASTAGEEGRVGLRGCLSAVGVGASAADRPRLVRAVWDAVVGDGVGGGFAVSRVVNGPGDVGSSALNSLRSVKNASTVSSAESSSPGE